VFGEVFSVSSSSHDQTVPNLPSPSQLSPSSHVAHLQIGEHFSRKVFVGGLPPDIDEGTCIVSCLLFFFDKKFCQQIVPLLNLLCHL